MYGRIERAAVIAGALAWGWTSTALLTSLIWMLPSYSLAVDVIASMADRELARARSLVVTVPICVLCCKVTWRWNLALGASLGIVLVAVVRSLVLAIG